VSADILLGRGPSFFGAALPPTAVVVSGIAAQK
jgi:hypothetical protein